MQGPQCSLQAQHAGHDSESTWVRGLESLIQPHSPGQVPSGPAVRRVAGGVGRLRPRVLQVSSSSFFKVWKFTALDASFEDVLNSNSVVDQDANNSRSRWQSSRWSSLPLRQLSAPPHPPGRTQENRHEYAIRPWRVLGGEIQAAGDCVAGVSVREKRRTRKVVCARA